MTGFGWESFVQNLDKVAPDSCTVGVRPKPPLRVSHGREHAMECGLPYQQMLLAALLIIGFIGREHGFGSIDKV